MVMGNQDAPSMTRQEIEAEAEARDRILDTLIDGWKLRFGHPAGWQAYMAHVDEQLVDGYHAEHPVADAICDVMNGEAIEAARTLENWVVDVTRKYVADNLQRLRESGHG